MFLSFVLACAEEDLIKNANLFPLLNATVTHDGVIFNTTEASWTNWGVFVDNNTVTQFTFSIPYDYVDFINEIYFTQPIYSSHTIFNYQINYTIVHRGPQSMEMV